jgi:hypothetical protein
MADAMSLADDPAIQKNISGKAWHIEAINHSLFAPEDPNLLTFHQGGIGDCYLLAIEHKLMAVCVTGDKSRRLPRGIVHGHVYAVLGYDATGRKVTVFNPWGNHVKPAGPPGLANGYPTQHDIFEVPLDEFVQIFAGFTYETDRPMVARN